MTQIRIPIKWWVALVQNLIDSSIRCESERNRYHSLQLIIFKLILNLISHRHTFLLALTYGIPWISPCFMYRIRFRFILQIEKYRICLSLSQCTKVAIGEAVKQKESAHIRTLQNAQREKKHGKIDV